jgi:valyl-tRNA synthetase
MSKTKGNVADPLTLIDEYGADALRLTLAMKAAPGKDVRMGKTVVEPYRNFGTKLWNAARFRQMNECALWDEFDPKAAKQTINRWIIGGLARAAAAVTRDLETFRFNDAAATLYHFVYDEFCAWYVELIKPLLAGDDEQAKAETRRTAAFALDQILKLLHPFMPFITEELWARLAEFGPKRARLLIVETWPALDESLVDRLVDEEIDWVIRLISETRSVRSELGVPAGARVPLVLVGAAKAEGARLERYQDLIERLARLDYATSARAAPEGSVTFVLDGATIALPLKGVIDFRAEADRLAKEVARLDGEIVRIDQKLANRRFVERAPAEVIEEQRDRRAETDAAKAKLAAALARIEGQKA